MAAPTTAINRYDLSISYSEFNLQANRRGFIGHLVLPPVPVGENNATFLRVLIESVLTAMEDTKRAPKGTYSRDDFEWGEDSYKTEEHGVEEVVDDRSIKRYRSLLNAEIVHTQRAINRLLQRYEYDVAAAVFNTTTFTDHKTAVSTPWSTAASADPIADIDAACDSVEDACGFRPNTLICPGYALRKMARTDRIEDLLKYSGQDDPKNLFAALRETLQIENILVPGGYKNTAGRGQSASLSKIWDKTKAMVAHIHDSEDLEDPVPRLGATIQWTEENDAIGGEDMGIIIEEYREEDRRGGVIRARNDRQNKILHVEAAHLLTGVTA